MITEKNNFIDFIIVISAFVFIFISSDANLKYQLELTNWFREYFYSGIFHERLFKLFDYIYIILSIALLFKFGINSATQNRISAFFLIITLINLFFVFLNPNHDAKYMVLGLPILSDVSIYTWLLFSFVLFYLKEDGLFYFFRNFTKYLLLFAAIKSLLLLALWSTGSGFYFYGFSSILMEEDNLLLFAFLQLVSMALYIENRKIKFLGVWVLLFIVELLSFRRSGMTLAIFSLSIWFVYYQIKFTKATKLLFTLLTLVVIISFVGEIIQSLPFGSKLYLARYVGEFIAIPGVPTNLEFQYNQHLDQSEYGLEEALAKLSFWGYGFGHDIHKAGIYYLGNSAIHNAYVASWMYHSLFYAIYLIILLLISGFYSLKLYFSKVEKRFGLVLAVVAFFLLGFYLNHWVLPLANVVEVKMVIFRTLLFTLLFRLTPKNVNLLFEPSLSRSI